MKQQKIKPLRKGTYLIVKNLNGYSAGDSFGMAYLWIDRKRYFGLRVDSDFLDEVFVWAEDKIPNEDSSFSRAPILMQALKELQFKILQIQITVIQNFTVEITALLSRRSELAYISLSREVAIEIYFYSNRKIPLLVDRRFVIDCSESIEAKVTELSTTDLREMLEIRELEEELEQEVAYKKNQVTKTGKYKREPRKDSLQFFLEKPKEVSDETLRTLLKKVIAFNDFESAALLRDEINTRPSMSETQTTEDKE